jgi:hypothetical protein
MVGLGDAARLVPAKAKLGRRLCAHVLGAHKGEEHLLMEGCGELGGGEPRIRAGLSVPPF